MLQIKNLSKSYGAKKAVSNLSFVVEDGDIMGFIGEWSWQNHNIESLFRYHRHRRGRNPFGWNFCPQRTDGL